MRRPEVPISPTLRISTQRQRLRRNAVKTAVFIAVTAALAVVIALTFDRADVGPHRTFHAMFADVSGLTKGSDVRAAGVEVGHVEGLQLEADDQVEVTFSVSDDVPLTDATHAQVRYADLTGDRYLDLTRGKGPSLADGATLPVAQTAPALDLDTLFNGFRPLTQALDPQQVNQLTGSLIAVTQGEGDALQGLLTRVASVTGTLANHDQLIDQVIDNLSSVLTTVDDHRGDLVHLIGGLQHLTTGLAKDRTVIGSSLVDIDRLASQSSRLLATVRPNLKDDIGDARRLAATVNGNAAFAAHYLSLTPDVIKALGRDGAYGSYFNFYLCGVRFKVSGPQGPVYTPFVMDKEKRCQG